VYLKDGFNELDEKFDNKIRIKDFYAHYPAGTSWKSLIHLTQIKMKKRFQRYDYGE